MNKGLDVLYDYRIYSVCMKTLINIKADKEIKEAAQYIAQELGLSLSAVMNAYLRQFIREKSVEFSLKPRLKPQVLKRLRQAEKDYKAGKNISPVFSSTRDAIKYLNS